MTSDSLDREPIEALAAEFIDRHRNGEQPTIEQYVDQYPDLAEEIRELFPAVAAMENLKVRKEQRGDGRASLGAVKLEWLGDFRIIGEIGRGGMGIVYEAEQRSLGRHVAVKVLPRQTLLDEKRLARFRREARTAAKLHHTNIVPILGIGESEGHHYYVMQFIRGVGLDEVIAQLTGGDSNAGSATTSPLTRSDASGEMSSVVRALLAGRFRHAARPGSSTVSLVMPAVASCLSSANTDVRELDGDDAPTLAGPLPTADIDSVEEPDAISDTVQLGGHYYTSVARIGAQVAEALRYAHAQSTLHRDIKPANLLLDARGVVWVADFGLAKAMEHDNLSRTGDIVGTLRYMAPEQLKGQADSRSDIYSLGTTLYELLTLRPAFTDAQCKLTLIGQTQTQEPVRPRRINSKIPRDLETIVLKSMAPEAERRYQTAADLVEDLHRFVEDRPILARRTTLVERMWRWCRRNRAVASLAGIAAVLLITLAVLLTIDYWRTKETYVQIEKAWQGEKQQRMRAEGTLQVFLDVLDRIAERYAPEHVARSSRLTVQSEDGDEIEVEIRPALTPENAALLEDLLPFYDRFLERYGENEKLSEAAALANHRIGDIYRRLGQHEKARQAYERSLSKYRELQAKSQQPDQYIQGLARIQNQLGNIEQTNYQLRQAETAYHQARELLETAPASVRATPRCRYELARTYYYLGRRPPNVPQPARGKDPSRPPGVEMRKERHQYLGSSVELLEQLVKEFPKNPDYPHLIALCHREGARGHLSGQLRQSIAILEDLTREYPDDQDFLQDLIETYAMINVRDDNITSDELATAEILLRTGIDYSEHLINVQPDVPDYEFAKIRLLHNLGAVLRRENRTDEALQLYDEALLLQSSLVFRFPDVAAYKAWKSIIHFSKARLFLDRQQLREARPLLEASTTALLELMQDDPDMQFGHRPLFESYRLLEETLWHLGDGQALDALRGSDEYQKAMSIRDP